MTRWMAGIMIALGMIPTIGLAQGPWSAPAVQQTGFHGHLPPAPTPGYYCPPSDAARTQYQLLPDDRGGLFDHDSRCDLIFKETLSRTTLRFDYLVWSYKDLGQKFIGAPVVPEADLTAFDPITRLSANDRILGVRANTFVQVPTLGPFDESMLNGARLTLNIPTRAGSLEADAWAMEQSSENILLPPRLDQRTVFPVTIIAAVPLLNNGVATDDTMILFSENYRASLSSQFAGTEGNWIFNPFDSAAGIRLSPIVGFRYLRLQDRFTISGSDVPDPLNAPDTILNHRITSKARNDVFGPQFGLKASTEFWKFTFDAETKFLFGINRIKDSVGTQQIFTPTEDPQSFANTKNRFTPTFDLGLKIGFAVSEHLKLHVGYDFLIGEGFSRANQNILYDAPASVNDPPQIRLNEQRGDFYAQGISIGGEVVFW